VSVRCGRKLEVQLYQLIFVFVVHFFSMEAGTKLSSFIFILHKTDEEN
jgi:hypothetical protein